MRQSLFRLFAGIQLAVVSTCGQGIITTYAGSDYVFTGDGKPALEAALGQVAGVGVDSLGNIYAACPNIYRIVKIDRSGILTVVAGTGIAGISGDGGEAIHAGLGDVDALAIASDGTLYFSDANIVGTRRIRRIRNGVITTVVKDIAEVSGLALDSAANLYLANPFENRVLRLESDGSLTVVAGGGTGPGNGDGGPARNATLTWPTGIAFGSEGEFYIADQYRRAIRKVDSRGIISTIPLNGSLTDLGLQLPPAGLAVDTKGFIYITVPYHNRILRISPAGAVTSIAGGNEVGQFSGDGGPSTSATLSIGSAGDRAGAGWLALDSGGNLYFSDSDAYRVRIINSSGIISSVAGNGRSRSTVDGEPALSTNLSRPNGIAFAPNGELYVGDRDRIARITRDARVFTFANVPARLIAVGPDGSVFYTSQSSIDLYARVRRIWPDGRDTVAAGNGVEGEPPEGGVAAQVSIRRPDALAVDATGRLLFASQDANKVYVVATDGTIHTFAGTGKRGLEGDGGPANAANLSVPRGLAVDASGTVYIADGGNGKIRKVTSDGVIRTVNLTPIEVYCVAIDRSGIVYASGSSASERVLRLEPDGRVTAIAGNGGAGFSGDGGPALLASFRFNYDPPGIAVDGDGNVFVADVWNNRIRVTLASPPDLNELPAQLAMQGRSGGSAAVSILQIAARTHGLNRNMVTGIAYSVEGSGQDWLRVSASSETAPALLTVTADPFQLKPGDYVGYLTVTTPGAVPPSYRIEVHFSVVEAEPQKLRTDPIQLTFTYALNSPTRAQSLNVLNTSGSLAFAAAARTDDGGTWLRVTPSQGEATPSSPFALTVTADASGLDAGTYTGSVDLATDRERVSVPVTMTISRNPLAILLSQSALTFTAVEGGGTVPPQNFGVLNVGVGSLPWRTAASTLSSGDWLRLDTTAGSSRADGTEAPSVNVRVDASRLGEGLYYGLVRVTSDTAAAAPAANSPQVATVALQVLPRGSNPGPGIQPSELVFTAVAGEDPPAAEDVQLYNLTAAPVLFTASRLSEYALLPADGLVLPGSPFRVVIQPLTANLAPGVHKSVIAFHFDDGNLRTVNITVILLPPGTSITTRKPERGPALAATDCTPHALVPALVSMGNDFQVPAGYPQALSVRVSDDCGIALDNGTVTVEFSNGDPPLSLTPLQNGRWDGTWPTASQSLSQITLKVSAKDDSGQLAGTTLVTGGVNATSQRAPAVGANGVTNAASGASQTLVSPGGRVVISGQGLSNGEDASKAAWEATLGGVTVFFQGNPIPLGSVRSDRIEAVIPFGATVNTRAQFLIQKGNTYANPVFVNVAVADPAAFQRGDGPWIVRADGTAVTADNPAAKGETISIISTGLGEVNPASRAGDYGPASPRSAANASVSVNLGATSVPAAFAGLAPGLLGYYQVDANIPYEAPAGAAVPLSISVGTTPPRTSPVITIPIRD